MKKIVVLCILNYNSASFNQVTFIQFLLSNFNFFNLSFLMILQNMNAFVRSYFVSFHNRRPACKPNRMYLLPIKFRPALQGTIAICIKGSQCRICACREFQYFLINFHNIPTISDSEVTLLCIVAEDNVTGHGMIYYNLARLYNNLLYFVSSKQQRVYPMRASF